MRISVILFIIIFCSSFSLAAEKNQSTAKTKKPLNQTEYQTELKIKKTTPNVKLIKSKTPKKSLKGIKSAGIVKLKTKVSVYVGKAATAYTVKSGTIKSLCSMITVSARSNNTQSYSYKVNFKSHSALGQSRYWCESVETTLNANEEYTFKASLSPEATSKGFYLTPATKKQKFKHNMKQQVKFSIGKRHN